MYNSLISLISWQGVAGAIFVVAILMYDKGIIWGGTRVTMFTWIVWLTMDFLVWRGIVSNGGSGMFILLVFLGSLSVPFLAIYPTKADWSITPLGVFFIAVSTVGVLTYWSGTLTGVWSVTLGSAVLLASSVPLFIALAKDPGKEEITGWAVFLVGTLLEFSLSIAEQDFGRLIQATAFILIQGITISAILHGRKRMSLQKP